MAGEIKVPDDFDSMGNSEMFEGTSDFLTGYPSIAVGGGCPRTVVIKSSLPSRRPRHGADVQHRKYLGGRH